VARQFLSLVADTDQSAVANAVPIPIFSCVGKSLVGGSNEDPFEHRQVDFAQERLGNLGLQIERLPGGHLTTNEQPEALAALIAKLERGLVRKTRASRRRTGYGKNTKARCRRRSPARTEATAQTLTWQFVRKAYTGWPLSLAAHPNLVVHGTANLSLQADISVTFPL